MQIGYFEKDKGGPFAWIPEKEVPRLLGDFFPRIMPYAVWVGERNTLLGGKVKVFYCTECQIMLIDLNDDCL